MKKEEQSYSTIKEYLDNYTMKGFMIKLRYNPDLKTQIINESKFLPDEASIPERLWYIRNSLSEPQLCPYCNSKRRKFIKANRGLYNNYVLNRKNVLDSTFQGCIEKCLISLSA